MLWFVLFAILGGDGKASAFVPSMRAPPLQSRTLSFKAGACYRSFQAAVKATASSSSRQNAVVDERQQGGRWSDSGRWERKDYPSQQFLLQENFGTYFKVPNPATLFTKIICTIGPKTDSETVLGRMMEAGMSAARINMSHGSHEYAAKIIDRVRKVARAKRRLCPIILDTKGPEIRVTWLSGRRPSLRTPTRTTTM